MLSFFLTTNCNLNCIYCYNAEERGQREVKELSLEFAKKGLETFFAQNSSRHIRFYGPGEPTTAFSLLKEIKDYAYSLVGEELTVEIQTNGVFSDSICKWLAKNVDIIWMSFDGPPDIQDTNRPLPLKKPSSPIIERNVKYLLSHRKKDYGVVGARITVSEKNINRQIEMIKYFSNMGINYLWSNPLFPAVEKMPVCMDDDRKGDVAFDMDTYVDQYIEAYKYAKNIGVFYGSFLTCNFDGCSKYHCRACTPVPHLTPDGYVSACDMASFGEDAHHMDVFIIGKWDEKTEQIVYYPDKIAKLQSRSTDNMPHCHNCEVSERCGGYCLGEVVNETGNLLGEKPIQCLAIKKIAKAIGFPQKPYDYFHP